MLAWYGRATLCGRYGLQQEVAICVDVCFCQTLFAKLNKKLSCRRETVQCFVSLNISLSHSRTLKVIRNDTREKDVGPY